MKSYFYVDFVIFFTLTGYHFSELTILRAAKKHSGNYSCVPSNSQPASVLVHIFKGTNELPRHLAFNIECDA